MSILKRLFWRGKGKVTKATPIIEEEIRTALADFNNPKIVEWAWIRSKRSYEIIESSYGRCIRLSSGSSTELRGIKESFVIRLSGGCFIFVKANGYDLGQERHCKICRAKVHFDEYSISMIRLKEVHKYSMEEITSKLEQRWKEPWYTLLCPSCLYLYSSGCENCGNGLDWMTLTIQIKMKPEVVQQIKKLKDNNIDVGILCCDCRKKFGYNESIFISDVS